MNSCFSLSTVSHQARLKMDLNQYYTNKYLSDLLIANLSIEAPNIALDIGFGNGDLLHAAKRRWNDISLVGIDLDQRNVTTALSKNRIEAHNFDGFNPDLPPLLIEKYGKIDLLISNPPYFSTDFNYKVNSILKCAGISDAISKKVSSIPTELVFLAQNLRLMNTGDEMGIILPAGLISGERWNHLRELLAENYVIKKVIQLPENSFKKTDAQTFILIISKVTCIYESANISLLSAEKECDNEIIISKEEFVRRADFNYYESLNNNGQAINNRNINATLFRGNISYKELCYITPHFIHTTVMPKNSEIINCLSRPIEGLKHAKKGDIIVARVGRRCVGRVAMINNGVLPVSDCVIVIRPNSLEDGCSIWKRLSLESSRYLLRSRALGVGAKYITHNLLKDVLAMI